MSAWWLAWQEGFAGFAWPWAWAALPLPLLAWLLLPPRQSSAAALRVPVENLLGEEGKGFVQVMQGFDFSRSLIGLQCIGTARQSLDETWAYIGERKAFGKPLAAFQGITHQLAAFDTKVEAARLLSYNAPGCCGTFWNAALRCPSVAPRWWPQAWAA